MPLRKTGRNRPQGDNSIKYAAVAAISIFGLLSFSGLNPSSESFRGTSTSLSSYMDFGVDETCTNLPTIRHSGSYFLDGKIKGGVSPDGVTPSFKVGSYYADKVPYHMKADTAHFNLVKELLEGREEGVVLDMGANQGFYTYYAAAMGMQVHSFEIFEPNFKCLQHGAEFNPKEVADRVHLYPVGLGEKNARFSMAGNNYEGHLKEGSEGPILGVSFDCFAHHMKGKVDFSNVAFVKLDVEGFEIAVLKGAQNSLFKKGYSRVGGMLMEVGPERWGRAAITFNGGVDEMKRLSTNFKNSYVLLRSEGGYAKTCPLSLADELSDKTPKEFDGVKMHTVAMNEWEPLLKTMEQNKLDCNFWYRN